MMRGATAGPLCAARVEAAGATMDLQEGILDHVLGKLGVAGDQIGDADGLELVGGYQEGQAVDVAAF